MKKIIAVLLCICFMLLPSSVLAEEETDLNDNSYNLTYSTNKIGDSFVTYNTYENGELLYVSYYKDDGNMYMIIDGVEVLALKIEKSLTLSIPNMSVNNSNLLSVSSDFILSFSTNPKKVTITQEVIDAGESAVYSILKAYIEGAFSGGAATSFMYGAKESLSQLAHLIALAYQEPDFTITENHYIHNGCDWLTCIEFRYSTGHVASAYNWRDNPSLGVATYMCKMASQTYPYGVQ